MQHYDELFQLKAALARSDVFHLLTGAWATPAERCFFWMGGFRPSELLKVCTVPLRHCVPLPWRPSVQPRPPSQRRRAVLSLFLFFFGMQILIPQLDPLTEQQLLGGGLQPPQPPPWIRQWPRRRREGRRAWGRGWWGSGTSREVAVRKRNSEGVE